MDEPTSAVCFRWTHRCISRSYIVYIEKLTKALQDMESDGGMGWRDGALGVNTDEKQLFSDLRKDLLTRDSDTVIRCEAEMLPA